MLEQLLKLIIGGGSGGIGSGAGLFGKPGGFMSGFGTGGGALSDLLGSMFGQKDDDFSELSFLEQMENRINDPSRVQSMDDMVNRGRSNRYYREGWFR